MDQGAKAQDVEAVFDYLREVDQKFSTYKDSSEIEKINRDEIKKGDYSKEMKHILKLAEQTKKETDGFFDIKKEGKLDPSGIVKGYAIFEGANILRKKGYKNFYLEIAGDVEIAGLKEGKKWRVGIQNPFNPQEIVKVIYLTDCGVATSGTYQRGEHIYNPKTGKNATEIASITVVGPNVYEADRFCTAAFAMGKKGIEFLEKLPGFEAYMVTKDKKAVLTSGFERYLS